MKRTITAATLALLAAGASATTLGVHLVSHHWPSAPYQHNFNPGVYVRFDNHVVLGVYANTLGRTSVYAGYLLEWHGVGVLAGAVTGYRKHSDGTGISKGPVTVMLAPTVALPSVAGFTPRLSYIPRVTANQAAVLHLSVERSF